FVLTGLTYQQEWEIPLFLVFLVIYLFTIVGNLGLIVLIWNDPQLHSPMYLFLGSLAFVDALISSTVTPNMLVKFFAKSNIIYLSECMIQFFSFAFSATTECFLLAGMAYDRYVAICKPLCYPVIMTNRLCIQLLVSSFVFTITIVLVSYTLVLFTILKKKSLEGIKKAFSTCMAYDRYVAICKPLYSPVIMTNRLCIQLLVSSFVEFVLTGLTYQQEWEIPLFLVFLVIYLFTIVGNLGLIVLIWNDPQLHIPMYFFLGSLAFVDASLSSTVTPKMLVNFFTKSKNESFSECIIQFFSFAVSATTECFLLAGMAYDRYVAICKPLRYPVIMTNRLCIQLLVSSFVGGIIHAFIHTSFLLGLTFCNNNILHHFYCDIEPLFKVSCSDPSLNILMLYIFSGSIQVFTIMLILVSYTLVLFTILKKKSLEGIKKAFST
ncbi:Olfactory receptor 5H2, partial [Galemys pyrenaicus]